MLIIHRRTSGGRNLILYLFMRQFYLITLPVRIREWHPNNRKKKKNKKGSRGRLTPIQCDLKIFLNFVSNFRLRVSPSKSRRSFMRLTNTIRRITKKGLSPGIGWFSDRSVNWISQTMVKSWTCRSVCRVFLLEWTRIGRRVPIPG